MSVSNKILLSSYLCRYMLLRANYWPQDYANNLAPGLRWVTLNRSKGVMGGAREDQSHTGRRPGGPRLAPGRMITVVVVTAVMVVVIV